MSLPYYKRFPRDFLEGTVGLSLEEKGAYGIVIDLIFMRDGRLEDDPRFIAGHLGCSLRKWSAVRDALVARGKIQIHGGIISNFRADYLLEETRKYRDKQAENGARPKKINGLENPTVKPKRNQPDLEEEKKEGVSIDTPKKEVPVVRLAHMAAAFRPLWEFNEFWNEYPRKTGKDAAPKAYLKALARIGGDDPATVIIQGIRRHVGSYEWRAPRWIPHPATWLNRGGWADQVTVSIGGSNGHGSLADDPRVASRHENYARAFTGLKRAIERGGRSEFD